MTGGIFIGFIIGLIVAGIVAICLVAVLFATLIADYDDEMAEPHGDVAEVPKQ